MNFGQQETTQKTLKVPGRLSKLPIPGHQICIQRNR